MQKTITSQENKYYYWHSQNVQVTELKQPISPTLAASMGMGGAVTTSPILILTERRHTLEIEKKDKDGNQQQ